MKRKELKILTENEIGFGILIEEDSGYISAERNEILIREMKENTLDFTKPIYVYATLQKYGVENQNGRIYSEEILKREAEKYQKIISQNASFHELDHPDCMRETAEILTTNGWKFIKNLENDEKIYTLDRVTGTIVPQKIIKKINEPYKGKAVKIKNNNADLLVTPNHRFWFVNKDTKTGKFYTAQDILEKKIPTQCFIPKLSNWNGINNLEKENENLWLTTETEIEEIDYNDRVYSVSVPNETYYVRDNGKSLWSGNSSVISLKGGSPHRIVQMWWEGNILVGKLEILVSRGYRESGIISCDGDLVAHYLSYGMLLGVSSRGLGTLKMVGGKKMVQPDFELVCWDVVSSPSTPGSFMYFNREEKDKIEQSIIIPKETEKMNKKDLFMDKLNSFLGK